MYLQWDIKDSHERLEDGGEGEGGGWVLHRFSCTTVECDHCGVPGTGGRTASSLKRLRPRAPFKASAFFLSPGLFGDEQAGLALVLVHQHSKHSSRPYAGGTGEFRPATISLGLSTCRL